MWLDTASFQGIYIIGKDVIRIWKVWSSSTSSSIVVWFVNFIMKWSHQWLVCAEINISYLVSEREAVLGYYLGNDLCWGLQLLSGSVAKENKTKVSCFSKLYLFSSTTSPFLPYLSFFRFSTTQFAWLEFLTRNGCKWSCGFFKPILYTVPVSWLRK